MNSTIRYNLLLLLLLKSMMGTPVFSQKIAGGVNHSIAICSDKKITAWGDNFRGELGNGTTTNSPIPLPVSGLTGAISVGGGQAYSIALRYDSTVWAWGFNSYGQLGDSTTTDRHVPQQVHGLTGITAISAGYLHSLALKNDSTVWAWGLNSNGQLGDGTKKNRSTPVQVVGLSGVIAIASGQVHSLALKNDGTVWAWGSNSSGELGDSSTIDSYSPVQVKGLNGMIGIAIGNSHSLAIKNDSTVWAWGSNSYGQLGDNSTTDKHAPVQVPGLTGIMSISGGAAHSLALKNNGTVWAWGMNSNGQLGDGSTTNRNLPVPIIKLSGIMTIASGQLHSLALQSDGTKWAWGSNSSGQLGNGTTADQYSPLQIVIPCIKISPITLLSVTACDQYISRSGHRVFTASGIYNDTIINSSGEDTLVILNLTIHKSSNYTWSDSAACSYTYHGKTYYENGSYHIVLKNAIGCDSNITFNLKLSPAVPRANFSYSMTDKKVIFTAPQSNKIYYWKWDFGDRSNNDTTYNPVHTYLQCDFFDVTLIMSNECGSDTISKQIQTCMDTTVIAGIVSPKKWGSFKIYPNPTSDEITLESEHLSGKISVEIYNAIGQQVLHSEILSHQEKYKLSGQSGLYVVRIRDDQGNKKTMKVIKE